MRLLVVGDVNSTLAGALAAVKLGIPVVHLEAGLRSGDMSMPEEVNRLVTDQLSAMLLTPVASAEENLRREAVGAERIHFVGNIMAESVLRNVERIAGRDTAGRLGLEERSYALVTCHRPENTDHPERAGRHRGRPQRRRDAGATAGPSTNAPAARGRWSARPGVGCPRGRPRGLPRHACAAAGCGGRRHGLRWNAGGSVHASHAVRHHSAQHRTADHRRAGFESAR